MGEKVITIQRTSKRYKMVRVLSWVVFLIGAGWFWGIKSNAELVGADASEASYAVPITLFVVFILMRLYARVGQWWNND